MLCQPTPCVTQVALRISPASFAPNEIIVKPGDPALCMFTIKRGLVASPEAVVGAGMHFGDDFLLTSYYRPYTVRALTFMDCFKLANADLFDLFLYGQYPIFQVGSFAPVWCGVLRKWQEKGTGGEVQGVGEWGKHEVGAAWQSFLRPHSLHL